jgi:hypothetical protein
MNWEAIGAIGEIIGAVAVLITLIYLAMQIKQNTTSVKASAHQAWIAATIAEQSAYHQESMAKTIAIGLFEPKGLDNDNWIQFAAYCHQFLHKAESAYYLAEDKIIEKSIADKELDRAANFLNTTGPQQWWSAGGSTQFTDEFVQMIENRMKQPSSFKVYSFTPGRGFHALNE